MAIEVAGFEHDYHKWDDSDYFTWRKSFCCGLLEVHGLQSMPTYGGPWAEPSEDNWAQHVVVHLAKKCLHHSGFGQAYFTAVVEVNEDADDCDECSGHGGYYDGDDEWIECEWCGGSGQNNDHDEVYDVFQELRNTFARNGIDPACYITTGPKFRNPNTDNICQMMILTVDEAVREAFRVIHNRTNYVNDFRHE